MVLSHECETEKDFNALVGLLQKQGMTQEDAAETAGLRPDADRWVVVAPLLTEPEIPRDWPLELRTAERVRTVLENRRSGYFAVPAGASSIPQGAVNINRACTVARGVLTSDRYLTSLSEQARSALRIKLAHTLAYRDTSVVDELTRAVGQRITQIAVHHLPQEKNKKREIELVLHLENGEQLQLRGAPIKPAMPDGPARQGFVAEPNS
jgi:hypothetical protein